MKFSRVYANKSFKSIKFNLDGLNIIIGRITNPKISKTDTHNLGKTLLIDVLDFLLLKGVPNKDKFFLTKGKFVGCEFYCEVQLNSGVFLLIKRGVDNQSKISFWLHTERLEKDLLNVDWDDEDIGFQEAKNKLNTYLSFDVLQGWPFRKSINYFLRHQNDYLDVFKLSKFKGTDDDWKPMLFELLGFDATQVINKYQQESMKLELLSKIKTLETEADLSTEEKDKALGLLEIKKSERDDLKNQITNFNFQAKELSLNNELVFNIDVRIQELNSLQYQLTNEKCRIMQSLEDKPSDIDLRKIKEVFNDAQIHFPEIVITEFEQLLEFNHEIFVERHNVLQGNLQIVNTQMETIQDELRKLQEKKSDSLNLLTTTSTFDKFKIWQVDLSRIEGEIIYLEQKIKLIDQTSLIYEKIQSCEKEINNSILNTSKQIALQKHSELRKHFNLFVKKVLNTNALLSLRLNKEGNIEFGASIQRPNDLSITEEDYGTSYRKLLCIAFDISLLQNYRSKSYYRFCYHDGALEALDNRKKLAFITTSRIICQESGMQQIITLIDSDLPRSEDGLSIQFEQDEYILELHDRDDSGRLFGFSF